VIKHFIPYGKQWIDKEDMQAVLKVLKSDFITQGPAIAEFEEIIRERTEAKYCVALANGTAALHLAVQALEIPRGKKGLTSPITFAASANGFLYNGLKPGFADIDTKTYNIDPTEIERKIDPSTSLLIPVHFAGQPADMKAISRIARKSGCRVIEDAAHAIGSRTENGRPVGNCEYSDMTIFSFHPVKTVTTGEGGAITTNSEELYRRLMRLRSHGITKDPDVLTQNPGPWYYEMHDLGFNYRLTDIQAALGISQMKKLDTYIGRRREIVARYNGAFKDDDWAVIPYERPGVLSAFHLYVIQIDFNKIGKTRKDVMEELRKKSIGTQVHYIPVPSHPYYRKHFNFRAGEFPVAEAFYERALSLPLYPRMTDADVDYVIRCLKRIVRGA
jgi:UDP-4-amino-4,6-dideoxy-N-acetyl-beta-L-altrosamine transaminase